MTENEKSMKPQSMSQWIMSLAIGVICCAILFVVFGTYLMNINHMLTDTTLRVELLLERQERMMAELESVRHAVTPTAAATTAPAPGQPAAVEAPAATPTATPAAAEAPAAPAPAQPTTPTAPAATAPVVDVPAVAPTAPAPTKP